MRDVVERGHHEVDRHEIDPPAFEPDRRHPRRQELAHPLDELEEVVRAVDLVHLAGARVADDDARAVHAPRHLALRAHDLLRLVLGREVGVVEVFRFLEHVLAEHSFVEAGGRDRAHVVEAGGAEVVRERDHVAGAVDVGDALRLLVRLEVVHRREMEEVGDRLVLELVAVGLRDAEPGQGEIAVDRHRASLVDTPVLEELVHSLRRLLAHEEVHHRSLALQQPGDEALADEAGRAGDEVVHGGPPSGRCSSGIVGAATSPRWRDDYMPAYRPATTTAVFSVRPLDVPPRLHPRGRNHGSGDERSWTWRRN